MSSIKQDRINTERSSNMKVNPDVKYVQGIIRGLIAKEGHCPCQVGKTEDNKCPCKPLREEQHCCCNLYLDDKTFNEVLSKLNKGGEQTDGNKE